MREHCKVVNTIELLCALCSEYVLRVISIDTEIYFKSISIVCKLRRRHNRRPFRISTTDLNHSNQVYN